MKEIFQQRLLTWFEKHKRDLPWRKTQDPYLIWLSEIILQQTRVVQGLPYYLKFIEKYPTIHDLANAPEDEIMKLWQGLGYYSRAKNMHYTAKWIVEHYQGQFPTTFKEIRQLKGIGDYTAAAIASFAYNQPVAVVDGNVQRVLARCLGIQADIKQKKVFQNYADSLLNFDSPAAHNQAMMEFGAIQCVPKNPDCHRCIMKDICYAYTHQAVMKLPVKTQKEAKPHKTAHFYYIENEHGQILIRKRAEKGIWANLYEIPNTLEQSLNFNFSDKYLRKGYLKHVFTHFVLHITWFHYRVKSEDILLCEKCHWIDAHQIEAFAYPVPVQKIIHAVKQRDAELLFF
ncbi:MAG: A/G-specific adenine glycosylase [Bacteroidia bacterium]|nr:A/G-specific adenine glycosylase [Bacteroidia bacterium]MDW8302136.1 A/G-specific adenine glycosylase [Bacteroidia bacterium]